MGRLFQASSLAFALLLSSFAASGCGGAQHETEYGHLPPWQGAAVRAFDDDIDADAVGLDLTAKTPPRSDVALRERAQTADLVARLRVQTVTVDTVGNRRTYHVHVVVGDRLRDEGTLTDPRYELVIRPDSPGYGIARALDTRMQGLTFIGFLKRFVDPQGEPRLHWHLSADSAEVARAVSDALALEEMSGS